MRALPFVCILALSLTGCVGVVMEGANITKDKVTIKNNIDKAKQGDRVAQYKVGDAYCCSLTEEPEAFYNTPVAVAWLCVSARNAYGPAMYKLGKIYSGDVVDGVRLIRRVSQGIVGSSENDAVAYVWLRHAAYHGVKEATKRATGVWNDMSNRDRSTATRLLQDGLRAKCRWEEVIRNK